MLLIDVILPAKELDTLVNEPEIWEAIWLDPDIRVGLPVMLAYATLVALTPVIPEPSPIKDPLKDPVSAALIPIGLSILMLFFFYSLFAILLINIYFICYVEH